MLTNKVNTPIKSIFNLVLNLMPEVFERASNRESSYTMSSFSSRSSHKAYCLERFQQLLAIPLIRTSLIDQGLNRCSSTLDIVIRGIGWNKRSTILLLEGANILGGLNIVKLHNYLHRGIQQWVLQRSLRRPRFGSAVSVC